ncbi:hypothetical protein NHF48_008960 [Sphingomonas sp. H160509]|uniref:hypothetical protein n=1 Tax=Sphingomonas sp. H160509 TaxID=2955313 RepID=UPI0020976C26|nr:hypothetical protein [Sphingomonas sp. H160509]MDD1451064.1 hypothetical protein [Sphingomonas sp. H160509]
MADNSPGVGKAIEAQIAQHYSTLGEWHAVRKHTAIDGAIVTVTLSLSAAAFGLSGFTMGGERRGGDHRAGARHHRRDGEARTMLEDRRRMGRPHRQRREVARSGL